MNDSRLMRWVVFISFAVMGCNISLDPGATKPSSSSPSPEPSRASKLKPDSPPIIEVTPAAAASIRRIAEEMRETERCYLRVRVVPGGCQGFMHKLDLDTAVNAEDHTFEASGVHVAILKRQVEMLRGAQVDFGRENDKEGFKVKNPNFEGEAAKRWLSVLQNDPVAK